VAIAATITLILISTYWVFTQTPLGGRKLSSKNDKAIINEVRTHPSSRTKIVLPDGTQVWVNSASRLLYNPDFGLTHRKVVLNGEAYFIVSKNKDLPFEIETKRIAIKVTGTTFNVRAYDDENKAETSLFEGSVQVKQNKVPEKVYFMKPNQKLVINEKDQDEKREELLPVKKSKALSQDDADKVWMTDIVYDPIDSLALETAWVFSTFAFYNESFQELALKMGKWYGVEIIFQSKNLENIRFTGRFTTETVAEALEALQFTAKFRFKRDQEKIFIY
jgi:ferric-dicitrate binding protein FerR (iron transport regulator)